MKCIPIESESHRVGSVEEDIKSALPLSTSMRVPSRREFPPAMARAVSITSMAPPMTPSTDRSNVMPASHSVARIRKFTSRPPTVIGSKSSVALNRSLPLVMLPLIEEPIGVASKITTRSGAEARSQAVVPPSLVACRA